MEVWEKARTGADEPRNENSRAKMKSRDLARVCLT